VAAVAHLGALGPGDVQVQLVHGPVGNTDEIVDPATAPMTLVGPSDVALAPGRHRYEGTFTCDAPGRYGFTVRVVPSHPDLLTWAELGRMAVA
jgi:starch phosphorylase